MNTLAIEALLLAERIDTRGIARASDDTGIDPTVVEIGHGRAFVFRAGMVALFGLSEEQRLAFLDTLTSRLRNPLPAQASERATLVVREDIDEQSLPEGVIAVRAFDLPRLTAIAEALAKAAALLHFEETVQAALDRVEPFASALAAEGRANVTLKELNRRMGAALMVQHRMLGRAAIAEKPEVLWDHPHLERLYARLENEYELTERAAALESKLDLLRSTTSVVTDLLQNRSAQRLEWAIVLLIVFEIFLTLYGMATGAPH